MPISGPSSYLSTTDLFIAHWMSANASLDPSNPIILARSISVTSLTDLRDVLETQRAAVESGRNALEGARSDIETRKAMALERLVQFNGKVRSLQPGTRWEAMLPKAFSQTEGMGRVLPPLDELLDLWLRQNQENPIIILRSNYAAGDFQSDLAALKTAYTTYSQAEVALGLARATRNETQEKIYEILKQYRQRIPSEFPDSSPFIATLPRLTPLPGSTPDAVTLTGTYDPTEQSSDLAWSEVIDEDVTQLELRATIGPEYDSSDETVVARFSPNDPREWRGTFGLLVPGAKVSFKMYAVSEEGNERGSNAITVTRAA